MVTEIQNEEKKEFISNIAILNGLKDIYDFTKIHEFISGMTEYDYHTGRKALMLLKDIEIYKTYKLLLSKSVTNKAELYA